MHYKTFGETYVVSIARGEEIVASLQQFCEEAAVTLGQVSGIGAAEEIELAYYNVATKEYSTKTLRDSYEITALTGNITTMDGKPYLHLHITVGDKNFQPYAGHLIRATVSGACEVFIQTASGTVERRKDDAIGLNLLQL